MQIVCSNCLAWDRIEMQELLDDSEFIGHCRACPPSAKDDEILAIWPLTRHDDWCLKFVARSITKVKSAAPLIIAAAVNLMASTQASDFLNILLS